eukprot:192699_1
MEHQQNTFFFFLTILIMFLIFISYYIFTCLIFIFFFTAVSPPDLTVLIIIINWINKKRIEYKQNIMNRTSRMNRTMNTMNRMNRVETNKHEPPQVIEFKNEELIDLNGTMCEDIMRLYGYLLVGISSTQNKPRTNDEQKEAAVILCQSIINEWNVFIGLF